MNDSSAPGPAPIPLPTLWFALLGGPAAWSAHLLGSYPLVWVACRSGTTAALTILTIATAVIAGAAAATGGWAYRRAGEAGSAAGVVGQGRAQAEGGAGSRGEDRGEGAGGSERSESRIGFMALCGLLLGILFTFAILMEGLPAVLQDPCVKGL